MGLIVSRFVHYLAVTLLFGASVFPLYALPRGIARPDWLERRMDKLLPLAALLALSSALAWLAFTAASMSGVAGDALSPDAIWTVIHDVGFGHIWAVRILLAAVILIVSLWPRFRAELAIPLLSGALLASIAASGHALLPDGPLGSLHAGLDGLHLLGAGLWLGGLPPLAWAMTEARRARTDQASHAAAAMLSRFSQAGYVAVSLLVGSGLIDSYLLVGSLKALAVTPYGRLLTFKIALFLAMIVAAAANRFWITPALAHASGADGAPWLKRIVRHIAIEQLLGLGVLFAVSILGLMDPSGGG